MFYKPFKKWLGARFVLTVNTNLNNFVLDVLFLIININKKVHFLKIKCITVNLKIINQVVQRNELMFKKNRGKDSNPK